MSKRELFRVEQLPVLQNRTYATLAEALSSPTGDINLVQDSDTGLIFNNAFDEGKLEYDKDYQNEQALSGVFKSHLDTVTTIINRHFCGLSLIEVGCGKGYFLDHLQAAGYDVTGIDPAYEGDNATVVKARFEASLGLCADAIVLRHVLEHIPDPVSFLANIARANGGRGAIYIEVPCLDWICHNRAWFDIYYEHVNYFRLADFDRMFGSVLESGHLFGGQYLYVIADLASLRTPIADNSCALTFPSDFHDDIQRLSSIAHEGGRSAIWGGASKGVIFAVHMKRIGIEFDFAIDLNPAKQDRYMPVTGLRIVSPHNTTQLLEAGSNIFVMNSNYLDEIVALSGNRYTYHKVDHE